MALVHWNPYAEMSSFRRQLDRLFDDIANQTAIGGHNWQPAIELEDSGENLVLKAQLPGLKPDDLDISASRDAITISGEYRSEEESEEKGTYHSEFRYGKFSRTVNLPVEIQQDKVTADYQNGIVSLTLPKVEDAVNRPVKINLGSQPNPALNENN
ncbi:MAG: Hsp20/alpha crystallin family protein [Halothece sp. Uz-M2-17]|nr:Hsp20/alpha crystallin family protein [Halothece sp. Uz-M2-17]